MSFPKNWFAYVTGFFALIFTGYVVLSALGKDTANLFVWMTSFIGSITSILTLAKQHETDTKVNSVAENVNGRMTQLITAKTIPADGANNDATTRDPASS